MIEKKTNLWDKFGQKVITTNGSIRSDGHAVMGRGCALQARTKFPGIARILGDRLQRLGNQVFWIREGSWPDSIVTFPVKHNWDEKADLNLIEESAMQLRLLTDIHDWGSVVVPRPGCGNGQLNWKDVKPILEEHLEDDRFTIVSFA